MVMNEALRMRIKAEELAERYRDAGIKVNESSMWHNPWTGAAEYDTANYGPGIFWICDLCGEQIIEDDTCQDCNWTLDEQEGEIE